MNDIEQYILVAVWASSGREKLDLEHATREEIIDFLDEHNAASFHVEAKDDQQNTNC